MPILIDRRVFLTVTAGLIAQYPSSMSSNSSTVNFTVAVGDNAPTYFAQGFDASVDLGTDGDYFVDALNGDDANSGTSSSDAFATIGEALSSVGTGNAGVIRVMGDGVKYRESLTMIDGQDNANRVQILGYGTDKPIWTGGDPLTGLTQCTVADEPVLGSNWALFYKKTVAISTFVDSEPLAANIFENNVQLPLSVAWAGSDTDDQFFLENTAEHYQADSVTTSGGLIQSYTDASVVLEFGATKIGGAILAGHRDGNATFYSKISSVVGNVITLVDQTQAYSDTADKQDAFALVNMPSALTRPGWGFVDNGDDTVTLYIRPNNSANITSNMEFCTRKVLLAASGRSHWTIKGIQFQQTAAWSSGGLAGFIFQTATGSPENIRIEHCRFYGTSFNSLSQRTGIEIRGDNTQFQYCDIENTQGGWGIRLLGTSTNTSAVWHDNCVFRRNKITRVSKTPVWFSAKRDMIFNHNRFELTGFAAHGNKATLYQQCTGMLVWGNVWIDSDGYFALQRSSGHNMQYNWLFGTRQGPSYNRAVVDQQAAEPPSSWGEFSGEFTFNNNFAMVQPIAYDVNSAVSLSLGDATYTSITWTLARNIVHNINENRLGAVTSSEDNWNAGDDGAFTVDDTAMDGDTNFTDPSAGDFTLLGNAPIRSASGSNVSSEIATLEARYSLLLSGELDLDCLGNTIDHTAPPIGPVVGYDFTDLQSTAQYLVLT